MLCPKLLRSNIKLWERWIFIFAQRRILPVLAPYLPIEDPRLGKREY